MGLDAPAAAPGAKGKIPEAAGAVQRHCSCQFGRVCTDDAARGADHARTEGGNRNRRLRGTPAQLMGIVYDRADEQAAIKHAIEALKVPENQRDRLIAQRRD
jgi:hypothetical protein